MPHKIPPYKNYPEEIFSLLAQNNPNPQTELHYKTGFELLVAVILSAQTTDVRVNQVTTVLFPIANTPEGLRHLGEEKLRHILRSVGLYRSKAKHLVAMSEQLLVRHNGELPKTRETLEALAGVGRKTAQVILNTLFDQPVIAVDTHIFRVSQRLGLAKGSTPLSIEKQLMSVTPTPYLKNAHHWLILHGRYTCKAKKPLCAQCILQKHCPYYASQSEK